MSIYGSALTTLDLIQVRHAYIQDKTPPLYKVLPIASIPDEREGSSGVKYRLPKLANTLINKRLKQWKPGQKPPEPRKEDYGSIIVSTDGVSTDPTPKALKMPREHKIADIQRSGPLHLDQLYRELEAGYKDFITSSTYFNTKAFAGAGALTAYGTDNLPFKDIEDETRTRNYRAYQGFSGLSFECHMDEEVARTLAGYEEYTHLVDSGRAGEVRPKFSGDLDAFAEAFRRKHGFDRVIFLKSMFNNVEEGQTAAIARTFSGVFWIGLIDRSSDSYKLTGSNVDQYGPGGAVACALSREPELREWVSDAEEVQYVAGVAAYKWFSPTYENEAVKLGTYFTNAV